jgi:hypothetical protein
MHRSSLLVPSLLLSLSATTVVVAEGSWQATERGRHSHGISDGDQHSYGISGRPQDTLTPPADGKQYRLGGGEHRRHHRHRDGRGIQGHKSFGLSRGRHYQGHVPSYIYRGNDAGVARYYFPDDAAPAEPPALITGYAQGNQNSARGIEPWQALEDYQSETARQAFDSQIRQQPNNALPRVGYALSAALSGDFDTGAVAMEQALLSDTTSIRYFHRNAGLRLIIEQLLYNYETDAFMTASLHYFRGDYRDAERAAREAARQCHQCTAVERLSGLIELHR